MTALPSRTARSAQVAPPLHLGLARLSELEVAGLDRAVGLVVRDDHAGWVRLRLDELQPNRNGAVAEEALALAERHREDQHAEFVDEAVLPKRLEEAARALDEKVGAVLALEIFKRCDDVLAQPLAVPPGELRLGARSDIFCDAIEGAGDRAVRIADIGPVCGENVVGLAAEQQIKRPAENFAERSAERLVKIRGGPAAELKAAGRVLLRAAGRLHDAIEAQEGGDDDSAHFGPPAYPSQPRGRITTHRADKPRGFFYAPPSLSGSTNLRLALASSATFSLIAWRAFCASLRHANNEKVRPSSESYMW